MAVRTVQRATSALASLKEGLIVAVNEARGSDELARRVNQIASMEGQLRALVVVTTVWERHADDIEADRKAKVANACVDLLTRSVMQDTWSGRGNDAVRSFNDGMKDVVNMVSVDGYTVYAS